MSRGAAAAAGAHVVHRRIGIGVHDMHEIPIDIGLIGKNHGQRGHDSLAYLTLREHECDAVVWRNFEPGIQRICLGFRLLLA